MTLQRDLEVSADLPMVSRLGAFGARPALLTADGAVSYAEVAERVEVIRGQLGVSPRLVHLAIGPDVESVVSYLACLAAGHPVLLSAAGSSIGHAYDPDVVVRGGEVTILREQTAHALHPDLALLLSTSGSTGSPKAVRLSRRNLQSNAEAISEALAIRPDDRAITSLPLHYCYGLSVLHSHIQRGAATVLTPWSVTEQCFWDLFRAHEVTTLAGVPHTFALLDRCGFADMELPSLRYVTQAGGRLAPEQVLHWADLGLRRGWDLQVMYGQTEATARMAVLPADLALSHPESVGRAIPGGAFSLQPCLDAQEPDVGELVYRGPNVMLGYASSPADLALGATIDELRTGDLARLSPDGLVEIVGRQRRVVKLFGLRLDLDHIEQVLSESGLEVAVTGSDARLSMAVVGEHDVASLRRRLAALAGVPVSAVQVAAVAALPRTSSGKIDAARLTLLFEDSTNAAPACDIVRVLALVLDRRADEITPQSTFVGLGGDSLSYVEASLQLEQVLGRLPEHWQLQTVAALQSGASRVESASSRPSRWRRLETSVVLRALAITLVIAHHAELFKLIGGAHLLLGVAGYNFARFHLTGTPRSDRVRGILRSVARVVVPSVIVIALSAAVLERYEGWHALLLNDLIQPTPRTRDFWFVAVLVHLLLATVLLLAVPIVDRLERRLPFAFAAGLLAVCLAVRFDLIPAPATERLYTPYAIAWLFLWGWAAAKGHGLQPRLLLTAVLAVALLGFFPADPGRALLVGAGLLMLPWAPHLRVPAALAIPAGRLASSSLHIYLLNFLVLATVPGPPVLGFLACLLAGVAFHRVYTVTKGSALGMAYRRRLSWRPLQGRDPQRLSARGQHASARRP